MNKTTFYLSECEKAAAKSPMCFKLGAVLVKGGKVISSGYNHHRPHYDGAEVNQRGHRKPVSMHAEMHAIFNITGMSPSFKAQVQGIERRVPQRTASAHRQPELRPPIPKGSAASERHLSGATTNNVIFVQQPSSSRGNVFHQWGREWGCEWSDEEWEGENAAESISSGSWGNEARSENACVEETFSSQSTIAVERPFGQQQQLGGRKWQRELEFKY